MYRILKSRYSELISDSRFSEVFSGSVWAISARAISAVIALISSIIIARIYGADIIGIVAVINSFLVLSTIFTVMGTNTSILRLIPEHLVKYSPRSAFGVYRKTLYLVILASLIAGGIFYFGSGIISEKFFKKPHLQYYIVLAAAFIVFKSIVELNTNAVRGLKLVRCFAMMQILPQSTNLMLLLFFGMMFSNQDIPIYSFLGGLGVTGLLGWKIIDYAFKNRMGCEDRVHPMSVKDILAISLPMLMTSTMTFIISQTGVIMLSIFRTEADVGYYDIAVKLAMLTAFVLTAINTMAAAKFSELYHSNRIDELFYVAKKSAKLIFWTTTPILVVLIIFGKQILVIAFGSEFSTSYPALVILVVAQFVNSISGSTGLFMNMTNNQGVFKNIMIVTAIINIIMNYFLIHEYGIFGAAVTAMFCISGFNIATLVYIKMKYGKTTGYFPYMKYLCN